MCLQAIPVLLSNSRFCQRIPGSPSSLLFIISCAQTLQCATSCSGLPLPSNPPDLVRWSFTQSSPKQDDEEAEPPAWADPWALGEAFRAASVRGANLALREALPFWEALSNFRVCS